LRAVLLTLSALLVAPTAAGASQRYASPTGTGSACTQATPCDLDEAVEDASVADGDEVIVTTGSYTTADVLVDDKITLHGEASLPRPTINVTGPSGFRVTDAATVRDLKVQGASSGISAALGSAGSTFERLDVSASGAAATACTVVDAVTIRDSVCWGSAATGSGVSGNLVSVPAGTRAIKLRNVTAVGGQRGMSFITNGGVAPQSKNVEGGASKLTVKAKGKASKKLKKKAKLKVKPTVAFTPTGGQTVSETKSVTLKLRKP